jgi:hypothetical protein
MTHQALLKRFFWVRYLWCLGRDLGYRFSPTHRRMTAIAGRLKVIRRRLMADITFKDQVKTGGVAGHAVCSRMLALQGHRMFEPTQIGRLKALRGMTISTLLTKMWLLWRVVAVGAFIFQVESSAVTGHTIRRCMVSHQGDRMLKTTRVNGLEARWRMTILARLTKVGYCRRLVAVGAFVFQVKPSAVTSHTIQRRMVPYQGHRMLKAAQVCRRETLRRMAILTCVTKVGFRRWLVAVSTFVFQIKACTVTR